MFGFLQKKEEPKDKKQEDKNKKSSAETKKSEDKGKKEEAKTSKQDASKKAESKKPDAKSSTDDKAKAGKKEPQAKKAEPKPSTAGVKAEEVKAKKTETKPSTEGVKTEEVKAKKTETKPSTTKAKTEEVKAKKTETKPTTVPAASATTTPMDVDKAKSAPTSKTTKPEGKPKSKKAIKSKSTVSKKKAVKKGQPIKIKKEKKERTIGKGSKHQAKPGTILIMLEGKYASKRVVYLKTLDSGLVLVTGPYKLNGVLLTAVKWSSVINTSTCIDIGSLDLTQFNQKFFIENKNVKTKKKSKFLSQSITKKSQKPKYFVKAQEMIDSAIIQSIKKDKLLIKYLKTSFTLNKGDLPHEMTF